MNQPLRQCVIVVNNTAAPANSGSGAAAKIGIIGRCPKFFAGRVCYTPSGAPETAESIAYFRGTVKCYRGSKKIGIVALDLKSRKKEFLNRYTRRMWNLRVRYVIASKGRRVVK